MRVLPAGVIFFLLSLFNISAVFAFQSGKIEYTVPIDYSVFDENALNNESENLFKMYLNSSDEFEKGEMLNKLLSNYSILSKINKDNPLYFVRLGIIYDKLGKDRYAKSNFCRGANLVPDYPYAFFSYGSYFFARSEYRKALREYLRAYNCGYNKNLDNLYHIAIIYEKLGDYSSAIKYYSAAFDCQNKPETAEKIQKLNELLKINSLYNENRRRQ